MRPVLSLVIAAMMLGPVLASAAKTVGGDNAISFVAPGDVLVPGDYEAYAQLQTFESALVYTIGDNEWLDCHRREAGGLDPRERP